MGNKRGLRETAEQMALLASARGAVHSWWMVAAAVVAVYEAGDKKAIAVMEAAFAAREVEE